MKFGTCVGMDPERIAVSGKVGFDYVETNMTELALADDDKLSKFINALQESGIPCEASNCFIPGDRYRIVGENVDYPSIAEYVDLALERAGKVGLKSAVFGSGGGQPATDAGNSGGITTSTARAGAANPGPAADQQGAGHDQRAADLAGHPPAGRHSLATAGRHLPAKPAAVTGCAGRSRSPGGAPGLRRSAGPLSRGAGAGAPGWRIGQ